MSSNYTIQPIVTIYAGRQFRSRLEARWAVFYTALGLRWDYEPVCVNGYVPDFFIHGIGWIEIKPTPAHRTPALAEFVKSQQPEHLGFQFFGDLGAWPNCVDSIYSRDGTSWAPDWLGPYAHCYWSNGGEDSEFRWCVCPKCLKPGIQFDGRGGRVCNGCVDGDKHYTYDHPKIVKAYVAAAKHRFC